MLINIRNNLLFSCIRASIFAKLRFFITYSLCLCSNQSPFLVQLCLPLSVSLDRTEFVIFGSGWVIIDGTFVLCFDPVLFLLPSERALLKVLLFEYFVPVLFLLPSECGAFLTESFFFCIVMLVGSKFGSFLVEP